MNKLATILLNSLLLTFSWQQDERTQLTNIIQLQTVEYNITAHQQTGDTDLREDLEFIASKDSNQSLLGGVILKSDSEHNSSTIYANFIFTDGQQLDKQSHYMAHLLGYQLIQPYHVPPVHTLLQWLAQNPEKKIHALAFNHPICPAWHYLLTIIYPEGNIELDKQACNPQSLTWPLNPLIMQYLDQKIMQSKKPLQVTSNILDLFLVSHDKKLTSLEEENQILQNELCKVSKALTYVPTQILHGHTEPVVSVAFSSDGKRLATGSSDKTIHIYDAKTYQLLKKLENINTLSITFSPDGNHLLSRNWDGLIHIYDAKTYQLFKTLKEPNWVRSIAFSPNGKLLALACGNNIHIYDVSTYQLFKKVQGHTDIVNSVIFSSDGSLLASASDDKTINIYDATTYQLLREIEESSSGSVTKLAFSFDNNHLACLSGWDTLHIYDLHTYQLTKDLISDFSFSNKGASIVFSPNGKFLALGNQNGNIYLYKTTNYELFKILKGHTYYVQSLAFSLNGTLASGSWDYTVRIWKSINFSEIN